MPNNGLPSGRLQKSKRISCINVPEIPLTVRLAADVCGGALCLVLSLVLAIGVSSCVTSRLDTSLRTKDGLEYTGHSVEIDSASCTLTMRVGMREVKVPFDKVDLYSTYQQVREAPVRLHVPTCPPKPEPSPPIAVSCERNRSIYFLELRGIGLKADKLYYGGEAALGVRIGAFAFGIGSSALRIDNELRTPVFVHMKYDLSKWEMLGQCFNWNVFADAGYPFDTFVSKYNLTPSLSNVSNVSPKMIGGGIGLDMALTEFMDLSFDMGYRYFTLATERLAPACDPQFVLAYDKYHFAFLRFGVTF
jgi:hypothetical protein